MVVAGKSHRMAVVILQGLGGGERVLRESPHRKLDYASRWSLRKSVQYKCNKIHTERTVPAYGPIIPSTPAPNGHAWAGRRKNFIRFISASHSLSSRSRYRCRALENVTRSTIHGLFPIERPE